MEYIFKSTAGGSAPDKLSTISVDNSAGGIGGLQVDDQFSALFQWFGQFRFSSWSHRVMELSENPDLRAATTGQAKSTGYFMKLRGWPEFDLIRPAGSNRLIVGSKTVRTIVI